jgi:hypothetical protein
VAKQATNGRVTDHAPTHKQLSSRRGVCFSPPLYRCARNEPSVMERGSGGEVSVGTKNSLSSPTGTAISNTKSLPTSAILPSFAITVGSVATQNRTGCQFLPSALGSPAICVRKGQIFLFYCGIPQYNPKLHITSIRRYVYFNAIFTLRWNESALTWCLIGKMENAESA